MEHKWKMTGRFGMQETCKVCLVVKSRYGKNDSCKGKAAGAARTKQGSGTENDSDAHEADKKEG